jgi:acyl-CoA thioesterase-1
VDHPAPYYTVLMRGLRAALIALALGVLAGPAGGDERVIVAFGDSLTAGFGVAAEEAWPALVEARLRREGYPYRVVNAGVSGDTTAGGLRRVDWVLRNRPEVAVVALGANDGLRGLGTDAMRANLLAIVERLRAAGARVLVVGMELPPNYGAAYARAFRGVFPEVARQTGSALMPFLLDGIAADSRLNQADGIHPNAAGHRAIAERVWPHLVALLRR